MAHTRASAKANKKDPVRRAVVHEIKRVQVAKKKQEKKAKKEKAAEAKLKKKAPCEIPRNLRNHFKVIKDHTLVLRYSKK